MVSYDYVKTRREDVRPIAKEHVGLVRFFMRWATKLNVALFRISKGRLANKFPGGFPICIVETRGAKTGENPPHSLNSPAFRGPQVVGGLPGWHV